MVVRYATGPRCQGLAVAGARPDRRAPRPASSPRLEAVADAHLDPVQDGARHPVHPQRHGACRATFDGRDERQQSAGTQCGWGVRTSAWTSRSRDTRMASAAGDLAFKPVRPRRVARRARPADMDRRPGVRQHGGHAHSAAETSRGPYLPGPLRRASCCRPAFLAAWRTRARHLRRRPRCQRAARPCSLLTSAGGCELAFHSWARQPRDRTPSWDDFWLNRRALPCISSTRILRGRVQEKDFARPALLLAIWT